MAVGEEPTESEGPGQGVPPEVAAALRERCAHTLDRQLARGRAPTAPPTATPPPAPTRYPWQWYWDSCFAAIAWRRIDPSRSRAELETLLAAATPDGFIGHTIFWGQPLRGTRAPLLQRPLARGTS